MNGVDPHAKNDAGETMLGMSAFCFLCYRLLLSVTKCFA